jgi:hypothetical protein
MATRRTDPDGVQLVSDACDVLHHTVVQITRDPPAFGVGGPHSEVE